MKVWIEKSIVKKRIDRNSGDLSLGKALWSPTKDIENSLIPCLNSSSEKISISLKLTPIVVKM